MKASLGIFTICAALSASVSAQESADLVQTPGTAQLKRASEAMIAKASQSISIRLPTTVKKGEIISIQYDGKGTSISDSFMVTGITIKDGVCEIENKRHTIVGSALSDLIYAQPCKKLR